MTTAQEPLDKAAQDAARARLKEDGRNNAIALLDSVIQEYSLKDKHLKAPPDTRDRCPNTESGDPMIQQDDLDWAAENGNLSGIKEAIAEGADPKHNNSSALRLVARKGFTDCVDFLIPLSDPKSFESGSIKVAAEYGHTECVRLLIPVSDPKVARRKLHKEGRHEALSFLDSILHEDELKAKHLDSHGTASRRAI